MVPICRIHGISEQLHELEAENARLRHLLADRDLEIDAIRSRQASAQAVAR